MRNKLPDDFKMNVLLPGAVWLLISAVISYAIIEDIKTQSDTATVILFIIFTLVVFAVPMLIYLEFREKLNAWSNAKSHRKEKKPAVCETEQSANTLPADFPEALKGSKTLALLDALYKEGFLDSEYRPYRGCNATQMAFIADSIAVICHIPTQWKVFGEYWRLNNMRQLLNAKSNRGTKVDKEDVIVEIFKRTAQEHEEIGNSDSFRSWMRNF